MAFIEALSNFGTAAVNNIHAACTYAGEGALGVLKTSNRILVATPIAYYGAEAVNASGKLTVNSSEVAKFVALVGVVYSFVRGIAQKADENDTVGNRKFIEFTGAAGVALIASRKLNIRVTAPQAIVASVVAYKIVDLVHDHVNTWFKTKS